MSRYLNAGGENVISSNAIAMSGSYTMMCWIRAESAPQAATATQMGVFDAADSDPEYGFSYDHANASFRQAAFHRDSGGTYSSAALTTSLLANTWYAIACTYNSSTNDLKAWLDGTNEATTGSVNAGSANTGNITIRRTAVSGTPSNIEFAWLGVWAGVVLTDDEIASFAAGLEPWRIRPESLSGLYEYGGNNSPEFDLTGGGTGTVTNATKGTNTPPVFRSGIYKIFAPVVAGAQTISAPVIRLNVNIPTSTITGSGTAAITPVAVSLNLNLPTGTITGSGTATITPSAIGLNLNLPASTITGSGTVAITPSAVRLNLNLPTAALSAIGVIAAPVVQLNLTLPAGTITGSGTAALTPNPVTLQLNLPTSVLTGSGTAAISGAITRINLTLPVSTLATTSVVVDDVLTASARDFTLNASTRDFDLTASA